MAIFFVESLPQNTSRILKTAIKALELLLLSAGLISTLVMVKGAVAPYSCEIVFSSLMGFCNSIKCLFSSSLYIWIIIHFIFMLIATSSSIFRRHKNDSQDDEIEFSFNHEFDMQLAESSVVSPTPPPPPPPPAPPPPPDITEVNEQESEEEDTLEATWKAIIGGEKEKPKKKNLKKSETWDVPPRRTAAAVRRLDSEELLPSTPKWKELRKSETFNDAVSITRRGGLRRDTSMSIEEFNNKVEAFIKKFNDNIRLQRQESDQRFLDMIGQGL